MRRETIAVIIQEGGKFFSELIKNRPPKLKPAREHKLATELPAEPHEPQLEPATIKSKATSIEAGCVPCSIGHLGTCVGVTNEAMRFAKKDGIGSREVIDRVNMCLDELNALERVDLRPEMIASLPDWEKNLANEALSVSRGTRHSLENLSSADELESVAAQLQTVRQDIGRGWFRGRLAHMNPEEKSNLSKKVEESLKESEEGVPENAE